VVVEQVLGGVVLSDSVVALAVADTGTTVVATKDLQLRDPSPVLLA